jgi:hypothetical protein
MLRARAKALESKPVQNEIRATQRTGRLKFVTKDALKILAAQHVNAIGCQRADVL